MTPDAMSAVAERNGYTAFCSQITVKYPNSAVAEPARRANPSQTGRTIPAPNCKKVLSARLYSALRG